MANAEYWRRRFESVETAAHKKADRTIRELDELFLDAQRTVQKEIESWYARYANSNGLSLSDAKKQLTAGELEEFKWDVKKYIEIGEKENLSKEWQKKLENASARFHVSRLESVQITIQQQLERLYGNETDKIDKHLRDVAGNGYTRTAYEIQKGIGIGWDITAVNETKLDALLSKPWTTDGKTFSDRLWSNQQQLVQSITKHLTQGLLRGDSHAKITEALKKDLGTTRYQAGRLVRTETTYMNAVAAKECYKDLGVDSVEIIATLDTHTCETCQPMDGKIIPRSQFEPGVTVPPFHPNCRCTTAPAIDEKYATERIARGADGKTYNVPANMTYEEWKKEYLGDAKEGIEKTVIPDILEENAVYESESYRNAIKAEEGKIFRNATETAIVLDKRGNIVLQKSDNATNYVRFTAEELAQMSGNVLTHNHPSNSTFSLEDIKLMVAHNLKAIRATGVQRTYQMAKKEARRGADLVTDYESAMANNKKITDKTFDRLKKDYKSGVLDLAGFEKEVQSLNVKLNALNSDWLKHNAVSYGYRYSVIERR